MSLALLDSVSLGLQYIWGSSRCLRGIRIDIHPESAAPLDAKHLLQVLQVLQESFRGPMPVLILGSRDFSLTKLLLETVADEKLWIELPPLALETDPELLGLAQQARQRGASLVWSGEATQRPAPEYAPLYARQILDLHPECARMSQRVRNDEPPAIPTIPIHAGQIYRGVESGELLDHCLDAKKIWGFMGGSGKGVVQASRGEASAPSSSAVTALLKAVEKDASIDQLEQLLGRDAILAYRFLRFINSASMGRRSGIDSLRRGLTLLGLKMLSEWLTGQLAAATGSADLQPLRAQMVFRALLTEHLLDAGVDHDLQKELYLSGLFSQLDLILEERMSTVLQRIPVSDRIVSAIGGHRGVYWPALDMARTIETGDAKQVSQCGNLHKISPVQVNKSIFRMLGLLPAVCQIDVS
jgi:EAL and modified HD-GYP domain-containing signal transduction protein